MIMTWKNKIKSNTQFDGLFPLDIFKTSLEVSNVNDDLMANADGKNIMIISMIILFKTTYFGEKIKWQQFDQAIIS